MASNLETGGDQNQQTEMTIGFPGVDPTVLQEVTLKKVILGESLKNPGLQTSVTLQSYAHTIPVKDLNVFKSADVEMTLRRPILEGYGMNPEMQVLQKVYRLEDRKLYNPTTEEFVIHACDQTMLDNAATLVSKLWKCTTPSAITREVLASCAGAKTLDIEDCAPARDYVAENIYPFQVISQQADAALASGNDPSFLHYMTYKDLGTHHFRSLFSLTKQSPTMEFVFSDVGLKAGYGNPYSIITHNFPCDFDLLSDIYNGIDATGKDINSLMMYNPLKKMFNLLGSQTFGCGIGSGNPKMTQSNEGSAQDQNSCPDYSQYYVLKRQARMALLDPDKIALRIVVPFNPNLHVGQVIKLTLNNRNQKDILNYGSGDYLVSVLTHELNYGGYSTTSMDCVSVTVGQGIV